MADTDSYQAMLTYVQGLLGRALTQDEVEHFGGLMRRAMLDALKIAKRLSQDA